MKPTAAAAIAACAKRPKTQRTRVVLPPRAVPSPRRRGQVDVADSSNPIIAPPTGYCMPVAPPGVRLDLRSQIWNSVLLLVSPFPGTREDCSRHITTGSGLPRSPSFSSIARSLRRSPAFYSSRPSLVWGARSLVLFSPLCTTAFSGAVCLIVLSWGAVAAATCCLGGSLLCTFKLELGFRSLPFKLSTVT